MRKAQQGAAVVMALFIVVLCTLAVSPLIWNLFATAKTISVAAARDQAEEVSRSGLDWARVILREDARVSTTDTLTEPWAVPLAESRISEALMRQDENISDLDDRQVTLTGRIEDATGRFNLRNLGADNPQQAQWLLAFDKLCGLLGIGGEQRNRIVALLNQMYALPPSLEDEQAGNQANPTEQPLVAARRWDEFRDRYGVTEDTWTQLRPYVVILPQASSVNANTASPEVLFSAIEEISFSDAQRLVSQRERVTFRDVADVRSALNSQVNINNNMIAVASSFFLIEGTAQVEEALIRTTALVERRDQRVYVIWRQ